MAYSNSKRCKEYYVAEKPREKGFSAWDDYQKILRYTYGKPKSQTHKKINSYRENGSTWEDTSRKYRGTPSRTHWEIDQPAICRVDDGLSKGLDKSRLKALGNAVVPQQIYPIFKYIMEIERGWINE